GSIIQTTGLLARSNSVTPVSTATAFVPEDVPASPPVAVEAISPIVANDPLPHTPQASTHAISYKPSHAEALAAHIYAFVSTASALSSTLSHPSTSMNAEADNDPSSTAGSGTHGYGGTKTRDVDQDIEGHEREDEDEVKLLRLRTKLHEIIIIPDRKFLLC